MVSEQLLVFVVHASHFTRQRVEEETHLRGKSTNRFGFSCSNGSSASFACTPGATSGAAGAVLTSSVIGLLRSCSLCFNVSSSSLKRLTSVSYDSSSRTRLRLNFGIASVTGMFSLFSDVKRGFLTGLELTLRDESSSAACIYVSV